LKFLIQEKYTELIQREKSSYPLPEMTKKNSGEEYPPVPDEFRQILETGTLMRDWQESAPLFRFALDLPFNDEDVLQMYF